MSQAKVYDLNKIKGRAEAQAAVKSLISALASLSGEIKRLEKVLDRYAK